LIHFYKRLAKHKAVIMVFEGAGQAEGLTVWRIEDFAPVEYEDTSGTFYVGDSYIVLKTKANKSGNFSWDIHFWLGSETSQDESGTAALMAVELDDVLGGGPVQHREVQAGESSLFLSYFSGGVRYKPGGVVSGFTHYDPEDVPTRLFKVKGKRNIQVSEVEVSASSLNKSDCFILDQGKKHDILVLMPPGAKKMEQFRANQVATQIRDEDHAGNAEVKLIDQNSGFDDFFEALGEGSYDDLPEDDEGDDAADLLTKKTIKLYKIKDDDVSIVSESALKQDMLESDDAFIVYAGRSGLYIWLGKGASKEEKVKVYAVADKLLADNGLPKTTKVTSVMEGFETAIFKQFFVSWREAENTDPSWSGFGRQYSCNAAIAEWNIDDLHLEARKRIAKSAGAAIGFMPDDGTGEKKVWRIENLDLVEVPEAQVNNLYNGDCYVIQYTYGGGENIVYFWQGNNCTIDERGASALHAARIDNEELGGSAMQVRVVQGDEPRHFIKMFGGQLVVLNGGKGSGFRNSQQDDTVDDSAVKLFKIKSATGEADSRAVQVAAEGGLTADDAYILCDGKTVIIFAGEEREELQEEVDQALRFAGILYPDVEAKVVKMGEDGEDEFWSILGADKEATLYTAERINRPLGEPRLFHVAVKRLFEISDFKKDSLIGDDVMILDSGEEVYVWEGAESDAEEKVRGLDMAKKYLDADPTSRDSNNCIVIVVKQG